VERVPRKDHAFESSTPSPTFFRSPEMLFQVVFPLCFLSTASIPSDPSPAEVIFVRSHHCGTSLADVPLCASYLPDSFPLRVGASSPFYPLVS